LSFSSLVNVPSTFGATGPTGAAGSGGGGGGGGGSGWTGATGALGSAATLSRVPASAQLLTANTATAVLWGTLDSSQSQGNTGLLYSSVTGAFSNTTSGNLVVLVEYDLITNITGNGSTYVLLSSGNATFGTTLTSTNMISNSCVILMPAGSSITVYFMDNAAASILTSSRVTLSLQGMGSIGPTGPVGSVAMASYTAPGTQNMVAAANVVPVIWSTTPDSTQSTGNTGVTYAGGTGIFTNPSANPIPLLIEYSLFLSTSGGGASFVGINGSLLQYGINYNDNNAFNKTVSIMLPGFATMAVYYQDTVNATVLSTSRITITLLTCGQAGPMGPAGQAAIMSYTMGAGAQSIAATTATLVNWTTPDATQSLNTTGLTYAAGLFTNNTGSAMPLLIEYSVLLNLTGGGAYYIQVGANTYGSAFNDNNSFSNSCSLVLQNGSSFGLYYMDNLACAVQTASRISVTLLNAGGPTGMQGPVGQAAMFSVTSPGTQTLTPAVTTLLNFSVADSSQALGQTGLTYVAGGTWLNGTTASLPLSLAYSVLLNSTGTGSTFVQINATGTTYGLMLNDTNSFTNTVTILLPPGAYFGIYYVDYGAPTVLTSSRLTVTLLVAGAAGPVGPTGPVGSAAAVSYTAGGSQTLVANTPTVVQWATLDPVQSMGTVGLTYSGGAFTNSTGQALPLLLEYSLLLNITGGGSFYICMTASGTTYNYGLTFNDNNAATSSTSLFLPAGAYFALYYTDSVAATIQASSRMTATLLVCGQQGPAGPVGTSAYLSYLAPGTQTVAVAASVVPIRWNLTYDPAQTTGSIGLSFNAATGLFTNATASALPLSVTYTLSLSTTQGGYSAIQVTTVSNVVTAYGGTYNDTNWLTNTVNVILAPGASLGVYYMDTGATVVQATSRISIALQIAGQQGPTGLQGPAGPVGTVAVLSAQPVTTQTITPLAYLVPVLWGYTDSTQSTGSIGLTYSAATGLFTNTTLLTLPLLIEYTLAFNTTSNGYSAIGINGNINVYGGTYNTTNWFSNSYTVLVTPGSTVGIYYMDNGTSIVQTTSRLSITLLTAGPQGATGVAGSVGPVNSLSLLSAGQSVSAGVNTLLLWPTADATNTVGNMGISYSAGLFTNTTGGAIPLLVEYSVLLNVSASGTSFIGVNGSTLANAYGLTANTTNAFTNSYSLVLPAGQSFGIYYSDFTAVTVQNTSRIMVAALTAGGVGPTGPVGSASTLWTQVPSSTQTFGTTAATAVLWGSTVALNSTGPYATTFSYASGAYTNATGSTLPIHVQYNLVWNSSAIGSTYIAVNGVNYGQTQYSATTFTNTATFLLGAGQSFTVYAQNSSTGLVLQTASNVVITVLTAGLQGPTGPAQGIQGATGLTGPQGITGPSSWSVVGTNVSYTVGNVGIGTAAPTTALQVTGTGITTTAISFSTITGSTINAVSTVTGALTCSTITTQVATASTITVSNSNVASYIPTSLTYYEEYTFSWTWTNSTGSTVSTNSGTKIVRIGNMVTLLQTNVWQVGLTNNTSAPYSNVNIPARFCPSTNLLLNVRTTENSGYVGAIYINTSGTIYGALSTGATGPGSYMAGGGGTVYAMNFGAFTYYASQTA
jgi:hypothetical protein